MDLSTTYLGMNLRTPLVVSASPLSEKLDNIRRMEDYGASAVVLYSLFEEQFEKEDWELFHHTMEGSESFAEAISYVPDHNEYRTGPDEYLDLLAKAKMAVDIPIIASLNGYSMGGWTSFAKMLQEAGSDALELNIYYIPKSLDMSGEEIEQNYIDTLQQVINQIHLKVAVKLSPYFSNLAHFAKKLDNAGANGLVLFNRFYQPDIDLEKLEVTPSIVLSKSYDMRLPLRWIALLKGMIKADLAATSGIHTAWDVIKMMMVGANVTQLNSILMKKGLGELRSIEKAIISWMEEHEYESIRQMQGSMSAKHVPHPERFERAQYIRALSKFEI